MVPKIVVALFNAFGITAFVLGFFMNLGDWKSAVLFGLGALYGIARLVVYSIKSWQDIRYREYHLKNKKKERQKESSSLP